MRKLTEKKVGIVGIGMVGGALRAYFEQHGVTPLVFDPPKDIGSSEEVNRAEIVFLCVPTPFRTDGTGFDLSYVEKTLEGLTGEKIVVIKSTVLPGTTEKLQEQFPKHQILFNPEFLVEERALECMVKPDRQIIGCTEKSRETASLVMEILPRAPYEEIMPSKEAEMVKYFGNTFLAMKVVFGCQMYELCQKLGINYDMVREAGSADPRIGPSHLDVSHGGYRGYGGKCLPKDTRALLQLADSLGVEASVVKEAEEYNNQLLKEQGIDDPEIFSKRG
jgi:UDPglucose 6-dehydrogenase